VDILSIDILSMDIPFADIPFTSWIKMLKEEKVNINRIGLFIGWFLST